MECGGYGFGRCVQVCVIESRLLSHSGYATPLELTHPPALTEDEVMRGFAPLVRTQEQLNYSLSTSSSALQVCSLLAHTFLSC